jgi:hypothetical protein
MATSPTDPLPDTSPDMFSAARREGDEPTRLPFDNNPLPLNGEPSGDEAPREERLPGLWNRKVRARAVTEALDAGRLPGGEVPLGDDDEAGAAAGDEPASAARSDVDGDRRVTAV